MALEVIISQRAEENLDAIVKYLSTAFSEKVKMEFLATLAQKMSQISGMPNMCRASRKKKGVRECVVNKYTIVYYKITSKAIEIITIQDSRKHPDGFDL